MYPSAFAGDDSSDAHIANALPVLFKTVDENLMNANDYQQTTLVYKGMMVTAFKSKTSSWVGFFKKIEVNDLPANADAVIAKTYKDYSIENVTMYLNTAGEINYFAELTEDKKCIILKIDAGGSIKVFNCMQHK